MPDEYDLILRNGTLYDGSGNPPMKGDLAIQGESIAALGDHRGVPRLEPEVRHDESCAVQE